MIQSTRSKSLPFSSSSSSPSSSSQVSPPSHQKDGLIYFSGPSSSSSSSPQVPTKVTDEYVDEKFRDAFGPTESKVEIKLSKYQKIQALLLLNRMQKEANVDNNLDINCNEMREELKKNLEGLKEISFSANHDLTDGIKINEQSPKVQRSLNKTFKDLKKECGKVEASKRPGFLERTDNNQKIELTKTSVHTRQDIAPISTKHPGIKLVFDVIKKRFIEVDYTQLDHADPWKLITQRVKDFLTYVNQVPVCIKKVFKGVVQSNFSDNFIIDKEDGKIYVTQYLLMLLYNDPINLIALNSYSNNKKDAKDFSEWIEEHDNYSIKQRLLTQIADPTSKVEDLLDRTGFIVKFKNGAPVKEDYRNNGIAEVLSLLEERTRDNLKIERHHIKNIMVLNSFIDVKHVMENKPSIDKKIIAELDKIINEFRTELAQGGGGSELREEIRNKFWKACESIKDDKELSPDNQPSLQYSSLSESDREQDFNGISLTKEISLRLKLKNLRLKLKNFQYEKKQKALKRLLSSWRGKRYPYKLIQQIMFSFCTIPMKNRAPMALIKKLKKGLNPVSRKLGEIAREKTTNEELIVMKEIRDIEEQLKNKRKHESELKSSSSEDQIKKQKVDPADANVNTPSCE